MRDKKVVKIRELWRGGICRKAILYILNPWNKPECLRSLWNFWEARDPCVMLESCFSINPDQSSDPRFLNQLLVLSGIEQWKKM
jgi:hypothetical protein